MDLLAGELGGGGGGSRSKAKDSELAKAMFEGTQQYRKKLKLPEMNDAAEKIKDAVRALCRARTTSGGSALAHR